MNNRHGLWPRGVFLTGKGFFFLGQNQTARKIFSLIGNFKHLFQQDIRSKVKSMDKQREMNSYE